MNLNELTHESNVSNAMQKAKELQDALQTLLVDSIPVHRINLNETNHEVELRKTLYQIQESYYRLYHIGE